MANVYKGVGVHWGTSSSAVSAVGTVIIQSRSHNLKADSDEVRDAGGNVVQKTYYNPTQTATFEMIASGASGGVVNPTLPSIGSVLTITDTTYTAIAGSNWLVDDVSTSSSNTSAMRVTINMTAYPAITS